MVLKGFTLIELLIVLGIFSVLSSIVLIAVNPFEQINQASDVSTKAVSVDFVNATKYYFTTEKILPWKKVSSCKDELASGKTLTELPSCVEELTGTGQLKQAALSGNEAKDIYVTECSDAIAVCYNPKSKNFNQSTDAKYTKNGYINPHCPSTGSTSNDCYSCEFSTTQAQECFQALNPNGTLAVVPSAAPDEVLPIPSRHSKATCSNAAAGTAGCMAEVVTDSAGNPLTSLALPAGVGPEQLHKAYNLPCTPGGPVQSPCAPPAAFGPQTVAVVIAYHSPTIESDLAQYSQIYGLPPCTITNGCLTIVNQNGTTSPMPPVDQSWALESALDVQMSHAVCQTCKILLVEASSNSFADLGIAVNRAAQMGATAISNSYGAPEWQGASAYDSYYTHPGIYVAASSGDSGYGNSYPASSKNVIAVGGTTLSLLGNNTYFSESVWSGTGSGCSPYQTVNTFQSSVANWSLTGCGTNRGITDIAADADPNTGVAIYNSTPYGGRSGWWILGGTSLSSPVIGAALALSGNAPSGVPAAAALYANSSKFRDVTAGSNGSCNGTSMCTAKIGYDGPTGLGSPNFLPSVAPTSAPTPTNIPTPTPTVAPLSCSQLQTVTVSPTGPTIALGGDTVNMLLTVVSNDQTNCSSSYTISRGFPTGWTVTGIPASFILAGGDTKYIPFTITVPTIATPGNYGFQYWVAKQGQSSPNPVNSSIQVIQLGPTSTPTPTPISCTQPWTQSLGSTSMSGNAGDTLNQTLTITNNNAPTCGFGTFAISYSQPSGTTTLNLPPSVSLTGGQSVTIPFTITMSTGAQIGDYLFQYWINSGGLPLNATIHVIGTATPPETQMFSNFGGKLYGDYATFEFSYNAQGSGDFRLDVATTPSALDQTTGPNSTARYGFAFTSGHTWDSSNLTTPSSIRGFIQSSPQSWSGYRCGERIYWRMYNSGDLRIKSTVQSGVVDCTTIVNILPWSPWYAAIYQGVYDARYDTDNNGRVDWTDYWILVRATRLR
jgi:prepilin-type N-terminal cleavage/methylation domain-containing protein